MTGQWIDAFRAEVNYDLEDRDTQLKGYLDAALAVALAYLGTQDPEEADIRVLRQACFVYAKFLYDTGGTVPQGVPPAFYNLLNAIKQ